MKVLSQFPFAAGALAVVGAVAIITVITGVDVVQVRFFVEQTTTRVGDALAGLGLFGTGVVIDWKRVAQRARQRAEREAKIQAERLRVLKATMRTVQDIVNNFLTNIQLVQLEGEGRLPPETLQLLDDTSRATAEKLKALGDMDEVPVRQTPIGTFVVIVGAGMKS